jgi:hypothetical protein
MKHNENQSFNTGPVPELAIAINLWLAARSEYKKQASDENEQAYNATHYALGEAWAGRYPDGADTPGAFEQFRVGLIAPEEE